MFSDIYELECEPNLKEGSPYVIKKRLSTRLTNKMSTSLNQIESPLKEKKDQINEFLKEGIELKLEFNDFPGYYT